MSEPICEYSDLPVSGCDHCRPPKPREPLVIHAATFARYSTDCPSCANPIEDGDRIYLVDEFEGWICGRCARA